MARVKSGRLLTFIVTVDGYEVGKVRAFTRISAKHMAKGQFGPAATVSEAS